MIQIGTMQGRLTPSRGRGMHFFPFENWQEEFYQAAEIGLNEIEWIFDRERMEENPLWTKAGIAELRHITETTGIEINSVCFNYFMRCPFFSLGKSEKKEGYQRNLEMTKRILDAWAEAGGKVLEIPLVDEASLKTSEEEKEVGEFISNTADKADEYGIKIVLETDLPPGQFNGFLESIEKKYIYATYDSGNSSGLGYDAESEICSLKGRIHNVHIKDKVYQGTTVEPGTGNADFDKVFSTLKRIGYGNSFVLEAARGVDGKEQETLGRQAQFIKNYLKKYEFD
ncbi:MAG: sugar phosphate isomerase/epimerase [Roseburia sp.]|nr:sugar phosphate isomerase/epimerase [Roseburia sp.]